jgi:hypothetical protein
MATDKTLIVLDPVQELAARVVHLMEQNAPKCSECGSTVLREKCFYELDPTACPRHETASRYRFVMDQIKRMGRIDKLPFGWKSRISLMQLLGPPTKEELEFLKALAESKGMRISTPSQMKYPPRLGQSAVWTMADSKWHYTADERVPAYIEEASR